MPYPYLPARKKERKNMKGFIHVLEIVIVGLTLLAVMALFINIPRIESEWMKTKLILYGNDVLFTLEESGINWLDRAQVNGSIGSMLPKNLAFDLTIINAIKPQISIGCVCPQGMLAVFEDMLNEFEFNGANISFRLEWINYSETTQYSELSFPVTLDLILFFDRYIPDQKRYELERYLSYDKAVLAISDLDTSIIGETIYKDIFGLEWVWESLPLLDYNAGFQETAPNKGSYKIAKYFHHLSSRTELVQDLPPNGVVSCAGKYASGHFSFRENNYTIWAIDNSSSGCGLSLYVDKDGNNWIDYLVEGPFSVGQTLELDGYIFKPKEIELNHIDMIFQDTGYNFRLSGLPETLYPKDNASEKIVLHREDAIYPDGRSVPVSVVNYDMINGRGRAVWLSSSSVSELKSDTKQLLRSLIVWAAGDEYQIARGPEKTNPVTVYFYKNLYQDMFQPIGLALTLGYR